MKKERSLLLRFKRLVQLKLVVPMKRSQQPPEYTARGVLVGMAWAMTPLVGIQMTTVLLTWLFTDKVLKWRFSLPVAVAWTWVTNVFTMGPIYYIFYVTGKLMMGQWDSIDAFGIFSTALSGAFAESLSFWEVGKALLKLVEVLVKDWGLAMSVGCLPWAVVCGWLSYRWSLKWLCRREKRKNKWVERRAYWRSKLQAVPHPHFTKPVVNKVAEMKKAKKSLKMKKNSKGKKNVSKQSLASK